jgi:autophagy-related protein 5
MQLPLLFPASESEPPFQDLATPLVQGIIVPKDAEIAWLGACMAGADGWVSICISLLQTR